MDRKCANTSAQTVSVMARLSIALSFSHREPSAVPSVQQRSTGESMVGLSCSVMEAAEAPRPN